MLGALCEKALLPKSKDFKVLTWPVKKLLISGA